MHPHDFWQTLHPPGTFVPGAQDHFYVVELTDGRQLQLPFRPLPDGQHALASLIINQASFAVLEALATDLANQLAPLAPEIIIGLPTLGLTLAAAVAQKLGHPRYIPLGTSAKFWYREDLSVPLSSITTPEQKRLYIDPRMLPLLKCRRVALIDDVISTGTSMAAALTLLATLNTTPTALAAAMLQSDRWKSPLAPWQAKIIYSFTTPVLLRPLASNILPAGQSAEISQ